MITLVEYKNEQKEMKKLIKHFWQSHNNITPTNEQLNENLAVWTNIGHKLYFIHYDNTNVGFIHLGSRGVNIDWLEDIFVENSYQNKGIGTEAIRLIETIVKQYSNSLYIEAAARNEQAINLYRKLGFDCLNTISIRKDFDKSKLTCIRKEKIYNNELEIRKISQK